MGDPEEYMPTVTTQIQTAIESMYNKLYKLSRISQLLSVAVAFEFLLLTYLDLAFT